MNLTTDRAVKKAYFSDFFGDNIVEFQFAPHELDFSEGGQYADRVVTGNFFTDLIWISGRPTKFSVQMFIDRTQESFISDQYNQDPFANFKRFPNSNPRLSGFDIYNMVQGLKQGSSSSGFATSFKRGNTKEDGNEVAPSNYSASPQFSQSQFNEATGVIKDLEAILYYVRPRGLKLSEITIEGTQVVSIGDYKQNRFVPPPKVRFYYGAFWREGYITEVKYNLSVMNKLLVPRRLDATIEMACTSWGYLNEIGNSAIDGAKPNFDNAPVVETINPIT